MANKRLFNAAGILDDEPLTDALPGPVAAEQVRVAVRAEADQMTAAIKDYAGKLVARANGTVDGESAMRQAAAAADLFTNLAKFEDAIARELDENPEPATIDLRALHAAIVHCQPEQFKQQVPHFVTPPMHQWTCEDTIGEMLGAKPRKLPMLRPIPDGTELTISDFFAGAGGSSSGLRGVPGLTVKLAVNHWVLAIETHNYNHPDTDHDQASLARTDPSRYPYTDLAWFSPECTFWSTARGDKCDYAEEDQDLALALMDDEELTPEAKEAKWRSRMLMRDVVRFSRYHKYRAVIVENVPDILKWAAMDRWLAEMVAEGYRYKILTLNSAFAFATGFGAPQLRDRVYVVFWQSCYNTPDWNKWLRPKAWCPGCEEVVPAIYNPKPGPRRPMRYGPKAQYTYRCPKKKCTGRTVQPLVMPAASVIDWSLPSKKIGGRKRPLAAKTIARVRAGVDRYFNTPTLTPTGGSWNNEPVPVTQPMRSVLTRESNALVVPMEGRGPVSSIRRTDDLFRTQSTRAQDALVEMPEQSFIAPLRNNGQCEPTSRPYRTFAANGNHHALIMRNNNTKGDQSCMSTPVSESLRTITTAGHQSLVQHPDADSLVMPYYGRSKAVPSSSPLGTLMTRGHHAVVNRPDADNHMLFPYDTGVLRPLAEPLPAQTTVQGDALLGGGERRFVDVDECTLRMLAVHEVQAGMAFDSDYTLLGSSNRLKVKMLGNAVTPNAARDLGACVMEAITGVEMDRFDDNPELWLPN